MRISLKLLGFLTLLMLGLPAAASAHGAIHKDASGAPSYALAINGNHDATASAVQYFEADPSLPQGHPCSASCCCEGISHCNSTCGASALNSAAEPIVFALSARRIRLAYDALAKPRDRKFGLERPPRA